MVKKTIKIEDESTGEVHTPVAETVKKADIRSADVISARGQVMRTYTLDNHGSDFAQLAKQFADKKGATVRVK